MPYGPGSPRRLRNRAFPHPISRTMSRCAVVFVGRGTLGARRIAGRPRAQHCARGRRSPCCGGPATTSRPLARPRFHVGEYSSPALAAFEPLRGVLAQLDVLRANGSSPLPVASRSSTSLRSDPGSLAPSFARCSPLSARSRFCPALARRRQGSGDDSSAVRKEGCRAACFELPPARSTSCSSGPRAGLRTSRARRSHRASRRREAGSSEIRADGPGRYGAAPLHQRHDRQAQGGHPRSSRPSSLIT